jgi:dolichol-phosphate mannosyltransferase
VGVPYDRNIRAAGDSKYSYRKLIKLAYNGIFNFSEFPIRFITNLGLVSIFIALVYLGYALFKKLIYGSTPEGFAGLLFAIVLFSGVQLISLGVIGQYVLRIFFQVKGRPKYVLKNKIIDKEFING